MNASMARRIRCAESSLIYAIDRQYGEQRERSQAAFENHAIRLAGMRGCHVCSFRRVQWTVHGYQERR